MKNPWVIAALAVAEKKPTLEVHRPHLVRMLGNSQIAPLHVMESWLSPSALNQPRALEYGADGACRRRRRYAVLALEHRSYLLRPPSPVKAPFCDDQLLDDLIGSVYADTRPAAHLVKSRRAERGETLDVLMAGLSADAEIGAQIGNMEFSAKREVNESLLFIHR